MNAFFTAILIEIFCIFIASWVFYFLLTRNDYDDHIELNKAKKELATKDLDKLNLEHYVWLICSNCDQKIVHDIRRLLYIKYLAYVSLWAMTINWIYLGIWGLCKFVKFLEKFVMLNNELTLTIFGLIFAVIVTLVSGVIYHKVKTLTQTVLKSTVQYLNKEHALDDYRDDDWDDEWWKN